MDPFPFGLWTAFRLTTVKTNACEVICLSIHQGKELGSVLAHIHDVQLTIDVPVELVTLPWFASPRNS